VEAIGVNNFIGARREFFDRASAIDGKEFLLDANRLRNYVTGGARRERLREEKLRL
jgi:hypothetical protein